MLKGDIYLVDFGKSRDSFSFGKSRPAIIFQTDKLNYAIREDIYDYLLVIPLSTKNDILTDEFRIKIVKREKLTNDSFAVVNSICFLHKKYFSEKLGSLNINEIMEIESVIKNVFDLGK
jgi:mRNA-degrading endonuclease toxin of MazEF toxin-antitoxin module